MSANMPDITFTFWNIKLVCMKCILPVSSQTKPLEEERERFFECDYPAAKTHIPSPHTHNSCKFKSCTFFLQSFVWESKIIPSIYFSQFVPQIDLTWREVHCHIFTAIISFCKGKTPIFQREPQTQFISMQSVWCCSSNLYFLN